MIAYEYIRLRFDFGDLSGMNSLSSTGWRVIHVCSLPNWDKNYREGDYIALMERELSSAQARIAHEFYRASNDKINIPSQSKEKSK